MLTNDEAGDARLEAELKRAQYDACFRRLHQWTGRSEFPRDGRDHCLVQSRSYIVHANTPGSKIILARGPEDVVPAIERVLGKKPAVLSRL